MRKKVNAFMGGPSHHVFLYAAGGGIPVGPALTFVAEFPSYKCDAQIAGALAAGCSIIIKPSEETPTAVAIGTALMDAGLPAGVLNIVCVPAQVSEHLLSSTIPAN